jgi:hypothetical protein
MPSRYGTRPLKAWRYVGVFGPELMLAAAIVRVGPARQAFWAVWDRLTGSLRERTLRGRDRGRVVLATGRLLIADGAVRADLALAESAGVETVCGSGSAYAWTRKQGRVAVSGTVEIAGRPRRLAAWAIIDDTAAYYERHTRWRWAAGVGFSPGGAQLAWNLVAGVNDPATGSERTIWVDGVAAEAPPQLFTPDLTGVGALRFTTEATRERRENRILVRSRYRQPFGAFAGELPGGIPVAEGWGVMEEHDVHW